jgi:hypothetical protein
MFHRRHLLENIVLLFVGQALNHLFEPILQLVVLRNQFVRIPDLYDLALEQNQNAVAVHNRRKSVGYDDPRKCLKVFFKNFGHQLLTRLIHTRRGLVQNYYPGILI